MSSGWSFLLDQHTALIIEDVVFRHVELVIGGKLGVQLPERGLLLIKGGVPGAEGGYLIVNPTVKVGK